MSLRLVTITDLYKLGKHSKSLQDIFNIQIVPVNLKI